MTKEITKAMKELESTIWEECKKGNVVVSTIEGFARCPVAEFVKQPVDGILYDLNRLPEVIAGYINDPKWINDYAVMMVIKYLHARVEELESELGQMQERQP